MTKAKSGRKPKAIAAGGALKNTATKSISKASAKVAKTPKNVVANDIAEPEQLIVAENNAADHVFKSTKKLSPIKESVVEKTPSITRVKKADSKIQEPVMEMQSDGSAIENSTPVKKPAKAAAKAVAKNVQARGKRTAKHAKVEVAVNHTPAKEKSPSTNTKGSNNKKPSSRGNRKRKLYNEVILNEVKDGPSSDAAANEVEKEENGTIEEELVKEPIQKRGRIAKKAKVQKEAKSKVEVKSENATAELNASIFQAKSEENESESVKSNSKSPRVAKSRTKKTPDVLQQGMDTNENEIEDNSEEVPLADSEITGRGKRGARKQKPKEVKKSTKIKAQKTVVPKKTSEDETATDVMDETETEAIVEKTSKRAVGRGRKRAVQLKKNDSPRKVIENASKDVNEVNGGKPRQIRKKNDNSAPMNPTLTIYKEEDFEFPSDGKDASKSNSFSLKISSWNVAGVRSWLKKGGLTFLNYEKPDIFCMQEVKCTMDDLPNEMASLAGYHPYWLCMPGGYAGVAIYSKIMPINIEYGIGDKEFDAAGRIITAEYEKFFLLNVYVLNSGRKLVNLEERMRWELLFQQYVQKLNERKPLIICGDMNVSHEEIDLANPKSNARSAGFTKEEREKMTALLSLGYVDTFRHLYPDRKGAYTYWTYLANARARNIGWRLDYFLVSERILNKVADNCIRSQCLGSDHCPITLFLNI